MKTFEFSLSPLKEIKPHWFAVPTIAVEAETVAEAEARVRTMLPEGVTLLGFVIELTPELLELRKAMGLEPWSP